MAATQATTRWRPRPNEAPDPSQPGCPTRPVVRDRIGLHSGSGFAVDSGYGFLSVPRNTTHLTVWAVVKKNCVICLCLGPALNPVDRQSERLRKQPADALRDSAHRLPLEVIWCPPAGWPPDIK